MANSPRAQAWTNALVLGLVWGFLLFHFRPSLLLLDTMIAGGDTPSFLRPVHHLRDVLLPAGNPQGWDLGNFAGYAPYQFYFLPPALGIVALSFLVPFNVAFKLVTASGVFLLPLSTLLALRALGYAFPLPAIGAAASLVFLFNEGYTMWGGNIPSTLAGEVAFSLAFALSVLFLGLLYQGVEEQRGWRSRALLLALTGLCHPVAFLYAAAPGLFFLLGRRAFVRNLRYLSALYGAAVLLMAFWLLPLLARLPYATSINWKWHFASSEDLLSAILVPFALLAGLDAVWVGIRGREVDRPARYLLFGAGVTVILFLNARSAGLPEIRFLPLFYFLLILLALDGLARVLPLGVAPHLGAVALTALCFAWVHTHTTFIPGWIRWNYEGLEKKPSYPLLAEIMGVVRGSIADPRVAYEHSPVHDRFGSMRVFEDLPLLAGRATLEGVLLQTAVNSPFVYWLQSQVSKQGTNVIPGYGYPMHNPARATARLALYNVSDLIVVAPETTAELAADSRWERRFERPPYSVFHFKGNDGHYVHVPRFRPVLLESRNWKEDFHRWFAEDGALEVPLVEAGHVPPEERARFPLQTASPTDPPRERLNAGCEIQERFDHLALAFTTTCPGLPHWIAVAYHPNWHVEGAKHVFLASPAFMLVFPEGREVRLSFRRTAVDWLGLGLSLAAVVLIASGRREWPAGESAGALVRGLSVAQPYLLAATGTLVLGASVWQVAREQGVSYFERRGLRAFEAQDDRVARREFEQAIALGGDSDAFADALFYRAASLLRSGEVASALAAYEQVIDRAPGSGWVPETHYRVGECLLRLGRRPEAFKWFERAVALYRGLTWADQAAKELQKLRGEGTTSG